MDATTLKTVNWEKFLDKLTDFAADIGIKLVLAIIIYIVGSFLIRRFVKLIGKMKGFESVDTTVAVFITNFVKIALYVVLAVSIVALLGVPMSSVIALMASIGVAIGMAMQGSLANIAGGIMLLIFRPFDVGDYISAGADDGTVKSINLFYTVLTTVDNRKVSVPNGILMNSSISNATSETLRRVDLSFDIAASEYAEKVEDTIVKAINTCDLALDNPEPQVLPFSLITDGITYAVRVWVKTSDYWPLHRELMTKIPAALNDAGIKRPATPLRVDGH